jgi:hypothetical protein
MKSSVLSFDGQFPGSVRSVPVHAIPEIPTRGSSRFRGRPRGDKGG